MILDRDFPHPFYSGFADPGHLRELWGARAALQIRLCRSNEGSDGREKEHQCAKSKQIAEEVLYTPSTSVPKTQAAAEHARHPIL